MKDKNYIPRPRTVVKLHGLLYYQCHCDSHCIYEYVNTLCGLLSVSMLAVILSVYILVCRDVLELPKLSSITVLCLSLFHPPHPPSFFFTLCQQLPWELF